MAKTQTDKLRSNTGFDAGQNIREAEAIDRLVKVTQQQTKGGRA
jgi:hypothetical protein